MIGIDGASETGLLRWAEGAAYSVMVVTDDPTHGDLIDAVFRHRGQNVYVHVAHGAAEARSYLAGPWPGTDWALSDTPDLIVLDLPEGGAGLEFLEWYGEHHPTMAAPVVVFSSADNLDLARICFHYGAREIRTKPDDYRELSAVVHRVLDRWLAHPAGAHPRMTGPRKRVAHERSVA